MEKLGIDGKLLIAQAINFIVFLIIFKKFIAKPFGAFITEEKRKQAEADKALESAKKQEEVMTKKMQKMENDQNIKMNQMIQEVKDEAAALKKQMTSEAHDEIKEMKEKAKKDVQRERSEIERGMQDKVIELSFYIVNRSLKEVLSDDSKKKITTAILKNLPKSSSLHEN